MFIQAEEQIWSMRPMNAYLLDSLAKTVSYLNELREPLLNGIMKDFYIAMDSYVSMVRDQTDEQSNSSMQVGYRVHGWSTGSTQIFPLAQLEPP